MRIRLANAKAINGDIKDAEEEENNPIEEKKEIEVVKITWSEVKVDESAIEQKVEKPVNTENAVPKKVRKKVKRIKTPDEELEEHIETCRRCGEVKSNCRRYVENSYLILMEIIIKPVLIIAFCTGTWNLVDHFSYFFPLWPAFALGTAIIVTLELMSKLFLEDVLTLCHEDSNWTIFTKRFGLCIYDYIYDVASVLYGRALWFDGPELWPAINVSIVCFIPLVMMRAVRNLVAPPIVIITDSKEFAFNFPTRFRIDGTRDPGLYILDCLFSVLVIGSLVVFVWRGLWVLLDLRLYPENEKTSAWASMIIGYAVVGLTFSLQPVMKWACEKLDGFWRIMVADVFLFISFIGTVNVWRGVWQLLDCYFIPENKLLSDWLTHGVSLILLVLLNCSNSVLVRGVYIDAEEPAGQCVVFPVYYIRLFFQKERTKKQKRILEKIDQNNTVLMVEKPQMNHTSVSKPMAANNFSILNVDDTKITNIEFRESDNNNEKLDKNGEHKIMCDGE